MIIGTHSIIYSKNPEADRAFLRDTLMLNCIDSGGGWLIFALPPSELGVHPSNQNDLHEFYLICQDIQTFMKEMERQGIQCSRVQKRDWGLLTTVTFPGGGKLGVYQATHARPGSSGAAAKARSSKRSRQKRKK